MITRKFILKSSAGKHYYAALENEIVLNLRSSQREVVIAVDYKPAKTEEPAAAKEISVKGIILKKDYSPATGYNIEILDKAL